MGMIQRVSLVILIMSTLIGCSNNSTELPVEVVTADPNSPVMAASNPGNITAVCGVLYKVDDFDAWLTTYRKSAEHNITILRSVNDPSIVLTFEGGESQSMVETRAAELVSEDFISEATVVGEPNISYFDVQYMNPADDSHKQFVALGFVTDDIEEFLKDLSRDINIYSGYGLRPVGIGTNPVDSESVYMLLALDDFVSFSKRTNSPRKLKRFINHINLPEETDIAIWTKTNL